MALDALNKRKLRKKFKQYIDLKQKIMIILNNCPGVKVDTTGSLLHHRFFTTPNDLYIQESRPPAGKNYEIFVKEGYVNGFTYLWVKRESGVFTKLFIFNDDDWMDRLNDSVPGP